MDYETKVSISWLPDLCYDRVYMYSQVCEWSSSISTCNFFKLCTCRHNFIYTHICGWWLIIKNKTKIPRHFSEHCPGIQPHRYVLTLMLTGVWHFLRNLWLIEGDPVSITPSFWLPTFPLFCPHRPTRGETLDNDDRGCLKPSGTTDSDST